MLYRGGNRPVLTPAHQVDLQTGMGPFGARIDESLTKPVSGKVGERDMSFSISWMMESSTEDFRALDEVGLRETEFGSVAALLLAGSSATSL